MIRVLVVDDHPALRAGLEALLRSEPGFVSVGAAGTGAQATALARRHGPDVVLLDVRLGDEDGIALCATLRALPDAPAVVMVTADAGPQLERAATAAGASALLDKAADLPDVLDAVRLAARSRRAAAPS
ncbi:response regulator transcription factor [Conexibacter sp. SYSU D00693]|uniref:response regulator transcription factor n=1 Tax=Conexibacter sp. SYSU D00693 TaxID=2812560 RepID=UPI00196A8DAF|nr:response regulator [Conexibacter sp. SYSU D00693]